MAKRLLRGIIDYGSGLTQEALAGNFQRLQASNIEWVRPADEKIHRFVVEFLERELAAPMASLIADFFHRKDDIEVVERLKDIKEAMLFDGVNYSFVLKEVLEEQRRLKLATLLKGAMEVAQKGKVIQEGREKVRIHGVDAAIRYLEDGTDALRERPSAGHTKGDLRRETELAWEELHSPEAAVGVCTGMSPLDEATEGLKPGELWVHAAHTGELKTTFALNWAYAAMTRYRRNVVYVCLEGIRKNVRRTVYVLHSSHPRFRHRASLEYRAVKAKELNQDDEAFYREVLDDFEKNPEYCRFEMITPSEPMGIQQLKCELSRLHRDMDIGMLVIDHSECLVSPSKDPNYGVRMNAIYTALRDLALQFDEGRGLPVLVLHQTNRQGKDAALKAGRYSSTSALSWANEAERSAAVVTAGFMDDGLRSNNQLRMQCLKIRDGAPFEDFLLSVHWPAKRLTVRTDEVQLAVAEMTLDEERWDALL